MDASERARWFDTEGNLYVSQPHKALCDSVVSLCISQSERAPLEAFRLGALRDGVESRILARRHLREFMLVITRIRDIAQEVAYERPYVRNVRKYAQVKRFLEFVSRERSVVRESTAGARQILDGFPSEHATLREPMKADERATWSETEGCLNVRIGSNPTNSEADLMVSQYERAPLEDGVCFACQTNRPRSGRDFIGKLLL